MINKSVKYGALGVMVVAIAAVVFFNSQTDETALSDIALANIEALTRYELPDVEVNCGEDNERCWTMNNTCHVLGVEVPDCTFTGMQKDYCFTLCW